MTRLLPSFFHPSIPAALALALGFCPFVAVFAGEPVKFEGKLAFTARSGGYWQIWILDGSTQETQQLTRSPIDKRRPIWFPDGNRLVYRTSDGALETVEMASGKVESLTPAMGYLVDPTLSKDGTKLLFARFEPEPPDNTNLYLYTFADKSLKRLTSDSSREWGGVLSPDGKRIAFVGGRGFKNHHIMVMDLETLQSKELQRAKSDDACPAWSPDGKMVAFSSNRAEGDYEIWTIRPDGLGLKRMTQSPGLDTSPTFSPDGESILFASRRDGGMRIWQMNARGENAEPLTRAGWDCCDPNLWLVKTDEKKESVK